MAKYLIMVCTMLMLNACVAQDEQYYRLNPQSLQKAIKNCPEKQPGTVSCERLQEIAFQVNQLAYQLQKNPQGFGQKILTLQQELAKQQEALKQNPEQPDLRAKIDKNRASLTQYLAIVKWLESPEG
ncbi:hypothetical protein [Legionella spiritensis]|uniref:Secreted endonuclease n=1 Tax=Legionella spiritensis TaxID=452 RepID=A0A0W0Z8M6_LEGSP|nr:hypothetical protein [Legionella spiritensis]KTD65458.1 secreted endonuclease [Legionella spiritensis]SNV35754.1 secreted endonuclease [Legionella spiritensis]